MSVDYILKPNTVQGAVYMALHDSIMYLQMAPGTVMSTQEIAKRMNVSRTPVREAFIRLEREGLVNIFPQKETIVTRIDLKRVEQERFMRESLEMAVQERFLEHCGKKDLMELKLLIEEQKQAREEDNYVEFFRLDNRFHELIFDAAEQSLSWEMVSRLLGHYDRTRLLTTWTKSISGSAVNQHELLVAAYENQDVEKAKEIMKDHLSKLIREEKILLEKYPTFFRSEEEEKKYTFHLPDMPF